MVLILPRCSIILHAYLFTEPYSNNVAEYNSPIIDLQRSWNICDSKLITNEVKGVFELCYQDLVSYTKQLLS